MIEPALTAEEWATLSAVRRCPDGDIEVQVVADGLAIGYALDRLSRDWMYPTREMAHLFMALANAAMSDGDPRKFTRADVQRLQRAEANCRASAEHAEHVMRPDNYREAVEATEFYFALASKLAALLPPE
jgi:hypothetical protein